MGLAGFGVASGGVMDDQQARTDTTCHPVHPGWHGMRSLQHLGFTVKVSLASL
jgi:hypothetical protein